MRPLILLCLLCLAAPPATAETLVNSGARVALHPFDPPFPAGDLDVYRLDNGALLATGQRLLVRVDRQARPDLRHRGLGVVRQVKLAALAESDILLLELEEGRSVFATSRRVAGLPGVRTAQPDILQIDEHALGVYERRHLYGDAGAPASPASARGPGPKELVHLPRAHAVTRGRGVRVAVIDDGFDLDHPALAGVRTAFTFDVQSRSRDVAPRRSGEKHGTMVAGILFAESGALGLTGVAPEAELIAIRRTHNWTSHTVLALHLAHLAGADVVNCSWGMPVPLDPVVATLRFVSAQGRGGLGLPIVFAAGNPHERLAPNQSLETLDAVLTVAGTDRARRVVTSYGPPVDIAAPVMVRTTDHRDHGKASYLGGSSSAAPLVSGTIALLYAVAPRATLGEIRAALTGPGVIAAAGGTGGPVPVLDAQAALSRLRSLRTAEGPGGTG